MDNADPGFGPPPFQPDQALQSLQRELGALGLSERAGVFERRGTAIARASVDGHLLLAARVKRPTRTSPEWLRSSLSDAAQVRHFLAELKKQLALWSDRDD